MLQLKNEKIHVQCPNGHLISVPMEDWEQLAPEINEKPDWAMGNEVHHCLELSDYPCPKCEALITAKIDVWEYPVGVKEYREQTANVNAADAEAAVIVMP